MRCSRGRMRGRRSRRPRRTDRPGPAPPLAALLLKRVGGDAAQCQPEAQRGRAPRARCHASTLWAKHGGRAGARIPHKGATQHRASVLCANRQEQASALACRTATSLRAASVQWHPLRDGWHRSPPLWAEIDASVQAPRRASLPGRSAGEDERLGPLDTHRPPSIQLRPGKRVDVWHPTSALARAACIDPKAGQCMAPPLVIGSRHGAPHFARGHALPLWAKHGGRAVAPAARGVRLLWTGPPAPAAPPVVMLQQAGSGHTLALGEWGAR